MLNNINIVLSSSGLPIKETGFGRISTFTQHRCELTAEGVSRETDAAHYRFDNHERTGGCIFQYTLAGEGRFQILPDGKPLTLYPGTAFLVELPSPTRYWLEPGTQWEFCYVILSGDMAHDLVRQLIRRHGYIWTIPPPDPAIDLIRNTHRQICQGRIPDEFESATIAFSLLMELFRTGRRKPSHIRSPGVERALRFIEHHYTDPDLTMKAISEASGYSRYHLSRLFKRETGDSPYAHLQDLRIRRALHLITSTRKAIKEVAFESGYRDVAHFCKAFKGRTQKTPMTFRRMGAQFNLSSIHVEA